MLQYIATTISILGGLFVMSHYVKTRLIGFYIWCITNNLWIIFGFVTGTIGILATFSFYFVSNVIGIYHNRGCKTITLSEEKLERITMLVHDAQYVMDYHTRDSIKKEVKRILCED